MPTRRSNGEVARGHGAGFGFVSRRSAIVGLASAGLVGVGTVAGIVLATRPEPDRREPDITPGALLPPQPPVDHTAAIGWAYLVTRPDLRSPDALRGALGPLASAAMTTSATAAPHDPQVAAAIRADFAEGRVVVLDSWHFSETEARIAALALLISRSPTPR